MSDATARASLLQLTLAARLSAARLRLNNERTAQDGVEDVLRAMPYEYEREHSLSPKDRVDFFVWFASARSSGVAIEVKLASRKRALVNQLLRYAENERVAGLIVVSSVIVALPKELAGKALSFVAPGRAWL